MLPPRILRRLVFPPLVLLFTVGAIVVSPLLFLIGLIATPSHRGRRRTLRLLWFGLSWLVMESLALLACLGLWIASGFGGRLRSEVSLDRHYGLVRWFLSTLFNRAVSVFQLRVEVDEPELTAGEQAARLARPVIVLSRHAGPGDSLLLVHHLLSVYGRRPRVVMKATMQLDPSLDVVGNRLPNVFVRHSQAGGGVFSEQIERLAGGLDRLGALVIFPEGGNWTPGRWRRGIRRLEERGREDLAARARDMPNLLPPRAGGALAAIAACPGADVIFVAHAGLDRIVTVGDVWRNLRVDQTVRAKWWRVPAAEVPRSAGHEAQVRWLYDWWQRIDTWISQNRPDGGAPVLSPEVSVRGQEAAP